MKKNKFRRMLLSNYRQFYCNFACSSLSLRQLKLLNIHGLKTNK